MNLKEKEISSILSDLKKNNQAIGIKAEFGTEGSYLNETIILKKLIMQSDLDLTIKIGGNCSKKNILEAACIGSKSIVCPMIESSYSLKKFINSCQSTLQKNDLEKIKLYINIETMTGYKNLEEIINIPEFSCFEGVVFGRTDFVESLGLSKEMVNSIDILKTAINISNKIKNKNKKFLIGGNLSIKSENFLKEIPFLSGFETRKVIFSDSALCNIKNCLYKALAFEILWLKYRKTSLCL